MLYILCQKVSLQYKKIANIIKKKERRENKSQRKLMHVKWIHTVFVLDDHVKEAKVNKWKKKTKVKKTTYLSWRRECPFEDSAGEWSTFNSLAEPKWAPLLDARTWTIDRSIPGELFPSIEERESRLFVSEFGDSEAAGDGFFFGFGDESNFCLGDSLVGFGLLWGRTLAFADLVAVI